MAEWPSHELPSIRHPENGPSLADRARSFSGSLPRWGGRGLGLFPGSPASAGRAARHPRSDLERGKAPPSRRSFLPARDVLGSALVPRLNASARKMIRPWRIHIERHKARLSRSRLLTIWRVVRPAPFPGPRARADKTPRPRRTGLRRHRAAPSRRVVECLGHSGGFFAQFLFPDRESLLKQALGFGVPQIFYDVEAAGFLFRWAKALFRLLRRGAGNELWLIGLQQQSSNPHAHKRNSTLNPLL